MEGAESMNTPPRVTRRPWARAGDAAATAKAARRQGSRGEPRMEELRITAVSKLQM
jgi:hypothetical protein